MRQTLFLFLIISFFLFPSVSEAQLHEFGFHFVKRDRKTVFFPFKLVHNLIIIPIKVNGSDTLNFVLDTGVNNMIITNWSLTKSIDFKFGKVLKLRGLGKDSTYIEAVNTYDNTVELPNIINTSHHIIVLKKDIFHLSSGLGIKIHGLIGYDLFKDFVVEINYFSKKIKFIAPKKYKNKRKRVAVIPLAFLKQKPYVRSVIEYGNGEKQKVKLLIDLGASNALSLFLSDKNTTSRIRLPKSYYKSYLGLGLSGEIFGYIGYISAINLGKFRLKKPLVNFPDKDAMHISLSDTLTNVTSTRNGSLGARTLKRFQVTFDYPNERMILQKGKNFNKIFAHNMSGIEIQTPFPGQALYQIAKVRKGSPAHIAGFQAKDKIIYINGLLANQYTFNDIIQLFQERKNKKITLSVLRSGIEFKSAFRLKSELSGK